MSGYALRGRFDLQKALLAALLLALLVAEGSAIVHSYVLAAALLAVLLVGVAIEIPIVPFLAGVLWVRIVTDASLSSTTIRQTSSVNLSAGIAILFTLVAIGLVMRRQQGILPAALVLLSIAAWTAVAVNTHGASTESVREGVREASILAVALIAFNYREKLGLPTIVRILQFAGVISAVVAIDQLVSGTGVMINGEIRSAGTFTHPNEAAMYFAIVATSSAWMYFEHSRRRLDLGAALFFGAAALSTFSLSGLGALLAMLLVFATLRRRSSRMAFAYFALSLLLVGVFLATPLGAQRIASESNTSLSNNHGHETNGTSLGWRFYKWGLLISEWEEAPVLGHGLGATVTAEGNAENVTAGKVPHNEYLRYLVETGALGISLAVFGVLALLRALWRRRSTAHLEALLALSVFVGCLVNALADNTFLYTTTAYAAALIIAAALAAVPRVEATAAPLRHAPAPL